MKEGSFYRRVKDWVNYFGEPPGIVPAWAWYRPVKGEPMKGKAMKEMSPEERSAEMKRRRLLGLRRKAKGSKAPKRRPRTRKIMRDARSRHGSPEIRESAPPAQVSTETPERALNGHDMRKVLVALRTELRSRADGLADGSIVDVADRRPDHYDLAAHHLSQAIRALPA